MALLRPLTPGDLHSLLSTNCDVYTETFGQSFYLKYLSAWPELCVAAQAPDGTLLGYIIGKVEGEGLEYHSHVTALSVACEGRTCGLAARLLRYLECCSRALCCGFVDLFVRVSNKAAVSFYTKHGYFVYKTETGYYAGQEDALDMRKLLIQNPMPQQLAPIDDKHQQQQQQQQQQGKSRKKKGKK